MTTNYTWATNPYLVALESAGLMSIPDLTASVSHLSNADGRAAWVEAKSYKDEDGYFLQTAGHVARRIPTAQRPKPGTPEPAYIATQWQGFPPEMHYFRNFGYVTDRKVPVSLYGAQNGWPKNPDKRGH
jgi:hypothetical protein